MNAEQQRAFDAVRGGKSILLTGPGGVGKSFVVKSVAKWARDARLNFGVTATTGSAAILIGGTTLHSYLGIGLGQKTPAQLAEWVRTKKRFVYNRLVRLQLLVIDEISMLDSELFEIISIFLGIVKGNNKPFGGVQLLLCGDLFQLPPIRNKYFFKSEAWQAMGVETIELTESQRHRGDLEFSEMLSELRFGRCSRETLEKLKGTRANEFPEGIEPTSLYSKNVDVDEVNDGKYEALVAEGARWFEYKMQSSSQGALAWASACKIPESVKLCVGAQVVLTWNVDLDAGLCNGARGVVVDVGLSGANVRFVSGVSVLIAPVKVAHEDDPNAWISFVPLRLAYALTINKAQGMTLDCAIIVFDKHETSKEFMYGRAYTALSRARNLASVRVYHAKASTFVAHPDVLEYYAACQMKTCAIGDGEPSRE